VYNLLFVCFSWSISVIAAAIVQNVRGFPTAADAWQQLQSDGYDCQGQSPQKCLTVAIFQGYFLDTTTVLVHVMLLAAAEALILWVKVNYKQHAFSCVFATICLVITMSYGAYYPYFNGNFGVYVVSE
jgi:Putative ER transporter, 6TM, N-terminal